jgi:sulfite exporter TauE/SafE
LYVRIIVELPLIDSLFVGYAHCRTVTVEHGGLLSSLFLAGLLGSLTHCIGMCGPFVLSQTLSRLESVPADRMREWHRLSGAALIPYHLGRATTYVLVGSLAATLIGGVTDLTAWRWVPAVLLSVAAAFFLGYALRGLRVALPWRETGSEAWWSRHIGRFVAPFFRKPIVGRGYALGIGLGFRPCGLLYGAFAAAASSGDAVAGALSMLAFWSGTIPALVGVALAGHITGGFWRSKLALATPVLMLCNAVALSYLAWRVVA